MGIRALLPMTTREAILPYTRQNSFAAYFQAF